MSSDERTITDEERRRAWLIRIAEKVEVAENFFPKALVPPEQQPAWVDNVERAVGGVLLPVAKVKAIKERSDLTPRVFGALVGHMCAMAVWTMEWIASKGDLPPEQVGKMSEEELRCCQAVQHSFGEWYAAMRRVAKFALCASVDQNYEDMSDFLLGYANAFASKPKTFKVGQMGGTSFEIYLFMMMFWRHVERLRSVRELHGMLGKVFGPYRIGELKRVEKVCQRIDLHFGKRGRPRLKA